MPKESFSCITSTLPSSRGLSTNRTEVGTVVSYAMLQPTRTVRFRGVQFKSSERPWVSPSGLPRMPGLFSYRQLRPARRSRQGPCLAPSALNIKAHQQQKGNDHDIVVGLVRTPKQTRSAYRVIRFDGIRPFRQGPGVTRTSDTRAHTQSRRWLVAPGANPYSNRGAAETDPGIDTAGP